MIMFLKVILVMVILAAMIILLLGLDHVFTGKFDSDSSDATRLRDEVEKHQEVISDNSVFDPLVRHSRRSDCTRRQPR